ncbi:MAG: Mrp/NBP35 family ATP-binding protein [Phycisphaerae bacterium]|nr:Mrp/NBP35 family ATP-binding protein [Phycisphaerae bacterium]
MDVTRETIIDRLRTVADPTDGRDVVTADRVRHVAVCDGYVRIQLQDAGQDPTARQALKSRTAAAVQELGDAVKQVIVEVQAPPPPQAPANPPAQPEASPLPRVGRIIAVGAGKGGVGKSTVAINLAVGLARRGRRVGLLDGDIYGPSTPTLLGLDDLTVEGNDQAIEPFCVHGIRTMTIGKLVDPAKPLIWRGPMAHGAFRQLALQTRWGDLDDLIIDLPPGTGDVPLTMSQILPLDGAVIVCTPQKVARDDAVRAAAMFEQLNVPVLGVVENMSYFIGDDGKEYDLFGRGGAAEMARELGLPLLAGIPINMQLRANSDAGDPTANFKEGSGLAADLDQLVDAVLEQVEIRTRLGAQARPTLNIS